MSVIEFPSKGTLLTEEKMIELLSAQTETIKKLLAERPVPNPDPDPEPDPEKPKDCKRKVTIQEVKKLADNKISVLFDAEGAEKIIATVKRGDNNRTVIVSDVLSQKTGKSLLLDKNIPGFFGPDTNTPTIVLSAKLEPNVRYVVNFKPTECTGEHSFTFFFDEVVVPPPEPEKPCKPTGKINWIKMTNE